MLILPAMYLFVNRTMAAYVRAMVAAIQNKSAFVMPPPAVRLVSPIDVFKEVLIVVELRTIIIPPTMPMRSLPFVAVTPTSRIAPIANHTKKRMQKVRSFKFAPLTPQSILAIKGKIMPSKSVEPISVSKSPACDRPFIPGVRILGISKKNRKNNPKKRGVS